MTEEPRRSKKRRRQTRRLNSSRSRRPVLLGVLFVIILFCASIALWSIQVSVSTTKSPKHSAVQTVDLDGRFSAQFAGEMIAAKNAMIGDSAKVDVRALPDTPDFVATIAGSRAIGVTSGQKFLLARWRGVPVTAFAASFLDTSTAIFLLASSGIRSPKDLIGKRLSYRPGSEDAVVFDAMLAQLGLPRSQVRNIPVQDGFLALRNGEIDALIAPIGSRPVASDDPAGRLDVLRPQDYGIHIPGLVYFANSALVRDQPSVIRGVLRAFILGWQEVYRDPDQAARIVSGYDPDRLSETGVKFSLAQQRDLVRPVGARIAEYDESRWNTLRDILLFAKLGTETVGISTAVNYEFLRDVYRRPLELDAAGNAATGPN